MDQVAKEPRYSRVLIASGLFGIAVCIGIVLWFTSPGTPFFAAGLLALLIACPTAFILSLVGSFQVRDSQGRLKGKGLFYFAFWISLVGALGIPLSGGRLAYHHDWCNRQCARNLRAIRDAKEQWARQNGVTNQGTPSESDLAPHLGGVFPKCPHRGVKPYHVNPLGTPPSCDHWNRAPDGDPWDDYGEKQSP